MTNREYLETLSNEEYSFVIVVIARLLFSKILTKEKESSELELEFYFTIVFQNFLEKEANFIKQGFSSDVS